MENREISDEALVEIVRSEDKEKYSEIIDRYEEKLLRYAFYLLGEEEKAKDVVQESFVKAYINLQGFNTKKKFSSWIYRIVHNEAINNIKKRGKEISSTNFDLQSKDNLEEDFEKNDLKGNVKSCLKKLPVKYRDVMTLYFLEEKSYDEISSILQVPISTVGTWLKRGKNLLKEICQKQKMQ